MRCLDYSDKDPAMNLALDEALLNLAEDESHEETLRFWESKEHFAVLGLTQMAANEINLEVCKEDCVSVQRRCSAGGCVLQGPGCLNYSLILDQSKRPEINSIHKSYTHILDKVAASFGSLSIAKAGISDLALGEKKISGNAQRRKKRFILHHGTLLYAFDHRQISKYLHEPDIRPEYRGTRKHTEFLDSIPWKLPEIKSALSEAFQVHFCENKPSENESMAAQTLYSTVYTKEEWVFKK